MDAVREISLVATVLTTGLMAGIYLAFSLAVMPGLRASDDDTFVRTMRAMNRAIVNPVFFLVFLGPLLLGMIAVLSRLPDGDGLEQAAVGLLLYVATLVITAAVSVPLNNALDEAPGDALSAEVRARFEQRWVRWNLVRTALAAAAFLAHVLAVMAYSFVPLS